MIKFAKADIGKEEEEAVTKVLRSGWLAAGEKTKEFEDKFAKFVGVKYAVFTNSCTSALKMAFKYYKEKYPQVWLQYPKNTYSATYAAAEEMGYSLGEDGLENSQMINVTVHYGGMKDEGAADIEDSAHRIEPKDPLIGKIRCYSFYVTKAMTTGYGGMFVTDGEEIYKKARLYWQDGISKSTYDRQSGGWNYTVKAMAGGYDGNDIAAAIGIEQLKKLPGFLKRRREIRDVYNTAFGQNWEGTTLFPFMVRSVDKVGSLIEYLSKVGIQASYHYPQTGWLGVSLPIYPSLTDKEQSEIINAVLTWLSDQY